MRWKIKRVDQRGLIALLQIVVMDDLCSTARDRDPDSVSPRWICCDPTVRVLAHVDVACFAFDTLHFANRFAQVKILRIEFVGPVESRITPDREVHVSVLPYVVVAL